MEVMPIDLTGLLAVFLGMLIVLIPVAGLTARFAFRPIVEAIVRARESQTSNRELSLLEKRIALLEQQMQNVEGSVDRLQEESEFRQKLAAPPS